MKNFDKSMLFEGIRERHMGTERKRLVEKWTKTGLLRGLDGHRREDMAQLLENQAAQVLRESNALSTGGGALTSSGQVQGFATIAFPIVRRVFGGLVSNELVSVQPMSLPAGLIFYLDYTYGSNQGGDAGFSLSNSSTQNTYARGQSIYTNPAGKGIQSGSVQAGGMYDLVGSGYTKVHQQTTALSCSNDNVGAFTGANNTWSQGGRVQASTDFTGSNARFVSFDPQIEADLLQSALDYQFVHVPVSQFTAQLPNADILAVDQISVFSFGQGNGGGTGAWGAGYQGGTGVLNLRRHNKRGVWTGTTFTPDPLNGDHIQFVLKLSNGGASVTASLPVTNFKVTASCAIIDKLSVDGSTGATLTIPSFETDFGSTPSAAIPEIDIKIESIAITAESRKLRARWSPELAQDLNAYHSLDAEVELTQILSQQIALEIDREVLVELLTQASGANLFWSRAPGKFVNKLTGDPVTLASSLSIGPAFTGTVREWYETLVETIIDVANTIHRKTLRGAANFVVCGPDVATIMEASSLYRSKISIDGDGQPASVFSIGCEPVGTLTNRFTVYKDPYFPRSKVLVGFKGGSYLETGYVYAPYVPLIVTQTIYAPDDFSPRRGVMTRYGKRMVRSDFYGTVTLLDMSII
jgi:hypothetical protein